MYFKNIKTGVTWRITDEAHQRRLKANKDYVKVADVNNLDEGKQDHSEQVDKSEDEVTEVDYSLLEWNELRQLASKNGINTKGLKRNEIENKLAKLGDNDAT